MLRIFLFLFLPITFLNAEELITFCGVIYPVDVKEIECVFYEDELDLKTLEGFKKLESLNLSQSKFKNINSISKLKHLKKLNLSYTNLTDISFVDNLPELKELSFYELELNELYKEKYQLKYIPFKEKIYSKEEIRQSYSFDNKIYDISIVNEIIKDKIYINTEEINQLSINNSENLNNLYINSKKIYKLWIFNTNSENINTFEKVEKISKLLLKNVNLTNLSIFKNLKEIRNLNIDFNIVDLNNLLNKFNMIYELKLSNSKLKTLDLSTGVVNSLILNNSTIDEIVLSDKMQELTIINSKINKISFKDKSYLIEVKLLNSKIDELINTKNINIKNFKIIDSEIKNINELIVKDDNIEQILLCGNENIDLTFVKNLKKTEAIILTEKIYNKNKSMLDEKKKTNIEILTQQFGCNFFLKLFNDRFIIRE